MKKLNILSKGREGILRLSVFLYFVIYFMVGIYVYKDYGFSTDEPIQWERSIVTYKYINHEIFHREVPELVNITSLEDFDHRYYGTAIQMPMVFIEDLFNFSLTTQQIFYMRHLITFLVCYAGNICFFYSTKKDFWKSSFGINRHINHLSLSSHIWISVYGSKKSYFSIS